MFERPLFEHLSTKLLDGEEHRPAWLNSALFGGGLVLLLTLRRVGGFVGLAVLTLIAIATLGPAQALWIPATVALAALSGMTGGLVFGLVSPRRGSSTFLTDWVSWTVGIIIYMLAFLAVASAMGFHKLPLTDPLTWYALLAVALVYAGIIAWGSRPDEYVRGGDRPLSANQRQFARRAASKRLWTEVERRLQEREQLYQEHLGPDALPEHRHVAVQLLNEQVSELDRLERALRLSIAAQGYGRIELEQSIRWRQKVIASLHKSGAA